MKRVSLKYRDNWQKRLETAGCNFHTIDGARYWNEEAAYELTIQEIDRIEDIADALHAMCLEHCAEVVKSGDFPSGYGFPDEVKQLITESWNAKEPSLFGRFDFGWCTSEAGPPHIKMYEYNADTPTALPEAAVWQWHALEDRGWPDQFNSIHESLVARWAEILADMRVPTSFRIHCAAQDELTARSEDWGNLHYMMEVIKEAWVGPVTALNMDQIGRTPLGAFVDVASRPIDMLFKLYPWEWMMADEYGWDIRKGRSEGIGTSFLEPPWKMLLSTKALLPLLWEKHKGHPNLLEAHFEDDIDPSSLSGKWIRKPLLGREGANVAWVGVHSERGELRMTQLAPFTKQYDAHGYVLQKAFLAESFPTGYVKAIAYPGPEHKEYVQPVLGVWMVGNKACGLGIREDAGEITTNASQFVPHYFVE